MLEYAIILLLLLIVAILAGAAVRRWSPVSGGSAATEKTPLIAVRAIPSPNTSMETTLIAATLQNGGSSSHLGPAQSHKAKQKFIESVATNEVVIPRGRLFLFYNVHEYSNPFGVASAKGIASLIASVAAEWVGLAETTIDGTARAALASYPYHLIANNGGTHLAVAWRDPLANAIIVPTTGNRDCIMLATRSHRIMVVHLEIGARPRPDDPNNIATVAENRDIRAANSTERILQLEVLVAHDPDMLIGDFNFEPSDPESEWLHANGYVRVSGNEPSTPFNRVDHCFVRAPLAPSYSPEGSALLPVAFSDHRPLIQVM